MERLQKVLAAAGIASRRKCEEIIRAGRVEVNGQVITKLGTKVAADAEIKVDGRPVHRNTHVYYLLNKPKGYVTTVRDTHGRPTVVSLVPTRPRVYPVGRLDLDTEGLLLLTNDGELTNTLLHPRFGVKKTYRAVLDREPEAGVLARLTAGVRLEDGMTAPAKVKIAGPKTVELIIHEGKKRQVRRMFAALGYKVIKLERIRFGFLDLQGVPKGGYRQLTKEEVTKLCLLKKKNL
ncbi:MAG: rRNA pseudouridine synthase [Firmicutes bacterium]|nr:rRNA pseudouridine synthase [Bacillota bacterium]